MIAMDQTPSIFQVHSTVRSPRTRTLRAAAPVHHRRTQFVLDVQARLIPNRPLTITEEDLRRNLESLKALEAQGIAEVRTVDGRKVDLETLTPAPAMAIPPSPNPPPDLAALDPKPGQHIFTAPGQPGYERHAQKPAEAVQGVDMAAGEDQTVVTEVEVKDGVAEVRDTFVLQPTAPGDLSEAEMAGAFGGPAAPEATSDHELEITEGAPVPEEVEHVEAPKKAKKGRRG